MKPPRRLRALLIALACVCAATGSASDRSRIVVASFSTSVQDQDENVKKNICIASRKLNGLTIMPHTVFSFNDIVGEGSAKNGFVDGRVLYRDEIAFEPGGGLCQVSSTLFNVLLAAGFGIVERHRHYQPVTYVPLGLDATILYGKKNLRMKNPYPWAFTLDLSLNDKSLSVRLLSDRPLPFRYEIIAEDEEIETTHNVDDRVRNAVAVYVYRVKYQEKKIIERFLLYKDFYPAVRFR